MPNLAFPTEPSLIQKQVISEPKIRRVISDQNFSPISWGRDYAECSAIQATLGALHDIEGLKQLFGGEEGFTHYLTRLATQAPHYEVTGYGYEIHEMSEMAQSPFGQIAISNQPSFHIPLSLSL